MGRYSPLVVVAALLLLLTYLLVESRSPDQGPRTIMQEALQRLLVLDAELNREVLLARAGLLANYDSLPSLGRRLALDLTRLEEEGAKLSERVDEGIHRDIAALTEAVRRKQLAIEYFKSDNAVLRNSMAYFTRLVQEIGRHDRMNVMAVSLSHAVMRFMQTPEASVREEAVAAVGRLSQVALEPATLEPLLAHAQIMVDLLPQVDNAVQGIMATPTGRRAEELQRAVLQSATSAEARAQRFRWLLYLAAIVLLVYLLYVFARLRAKARELRRKEIQLIQANKMTSLGTLVSSVAHEVNNPNQIVLMNAAVLGSAWSDVVDVLDSYRNEHGDFAVAGLPYTEMRDTTSQLIREVQDGSRRIERIIGDLKNFARPGVRASEPFYLNDVARRAVRLLGHVIHKRTDAFHLELADDLPFLQGDPQHVEQVAVNLVINALEALPNRTAAVFMSTSLDDANRQVALEIRDEGVGIPREHLARLGEAFFTTKESSGGTGLGIAIASSLVRLHHGQLEFVSLPGKGTRATATFPVALQERPITAVKASRQRS